jgi:secreted PhoX family phosphatase
VPEVRGVARGTTRRELIATGLIAGGAISLGPAYWEALARPARPGPGPYGPIGDPDANGLRLPEGFSSRVIAQGLVPVTGTTYLWHIFSDGSATYRVPGGGWILVSNSETPTPVELPIDVGSPGEGGASAIRFSADGEIEDAYRILSGTSTNCAGGATPWGTWLSCEEIADGLVWECDPRGENEAEALPALGTFTHEAVCVDRRRGHLYLSEDEGDGGFYRFTPKRKGDLSKGRLEVARLRDGVVEWLRVPDRSAATTPTRHQLPKMTKFERGEGIWYSRGRVYLATTGDSRIWSYNVRNHRMRPIYDPEKITDPPLTDVDNVAVHRSGDLFVCEDNGAPDAYDVAIITRRPRRRVARFAKLTGSQHGEPGTEASSEVTGVCFSPDGMRMYFASQRAYSVGVIYEVSGPFRDPPKRRR